MKKLITSAFILLLAITSIVAQSVPQGMKYQAVARDKTGEILPNEPISIRIVLQSEGQSAYYTETHIVETNDLGLFSLIIGAGDVVDGDFDAVPWSSENVWIEIGIKGKNESEYAEISTSQLLAVPYAFHAATASEISNRYTNGNGTVNKNQPGVPSNNWSLQGNYNSDPAVDKLGNTDSVDLVLVTNNIERLRIQGNGDINLKKSLEIGEDLNVNGNATLNILGGQTNNNGDFTVTNASVTYLTGALNVDGATDLNNTLNVDGTTNLNSSLDVNNLAPTNLTGTLNVDGVTTIDDSLAVSGKSQFDQNMNVDASVVTDKLVVSQESQPDPEPRGGSIADIRGLLVVDSISIVGGVNIGGNLRVQGDSVIIDNHLVVGENTTIGGNLRVQGDSVIIDNNLVVGENTTIGEDLKVTGDSVIIDNYLIVGEDATIGGNLEVSNNDANHVATIENTNSGSGGDGLKIKINRNHGLYSPSNSNSNADGYLFLTSSTDQLLQTRINVVRTLLVGTANGQTPSLDLQTILQLLPADLLAGTVIEITNKVIGQINGVLSLPVTMDEVSTVVSAVTGNVELFPAIPTIPNPFPVFAIADFTTYQNVANSLTSENEYVTFVDGGDRVVGSIKAQSIDDFLDGTIYDDLYLYNITSTLMSLDLVGAISATIAEISTLTDQYNSIGVEYASGNGDYAEWLKRVDVNEVIGYGDIVAVKGGKITKDVIGAEQIMAVSNKPIVLGNVPESGETHLGNNVAFMGQIPVKVMGPVISGDYIVAKGNIPGYGVAIHLEDMTTEDFKMVVGRAWESNTQEGPKMINTVIGVHNGDWVKKMNDLSLDLDQLESNLNNMENQLLFIEQSLNKK